MMIQHRFRSLKVALVAFFGFVTFGWFGQLPCRAGTLADELYINEVFINPASTNDKPWEYIELRGTPNMLLSNYYFVAIESEDDGFDTGNAGKIDHIFNLNNAGSVRVGSNGFLTLRMAGSPFTVAPGTTDRVNSFAATGFGNGGTSSIGSSDDIGDGSDGELENGGSTYWLIRNDSAGGAHAPTIGFDVDEGNNGLDHLVNNSGRWSFENAATGLKWSILDSIGFAEPAEIFDGQFYAQINFGKEFAHPELPPADPDYLNPAEHIEAANGAKYVGLGYEIELLARWGNSTGQTEKDWHITNITNNLGSGYQAGSTGFRQSTSAAHPPNDNNINTPPAQPSQVDTNRNVPYGTNLTNTLGAPNYLTGDFNKDGIVDAADYTVWRNTRGQLGTDVVDQPADANHDYKVDILDYNLWKANYGAPFASAAGSGSLVGGSQVPEPGSIILCAVALLMAVASRVRR